MKKKSSTAPDFSPEKLRELEETTIANIIEKVNAGGVPTAREQSILAQAAARKSAAAETPPAPAAAAYVQNWNELADAIPIDRRTLQNFRDQHADLIETNKKDLIRADGRKNIVAWRELIAQCGVRGRGTNKTDPEDLDARALDLAERRLKLERATFELEKAKDAMLPVAQFERAWSKTHAALLAAIDAFGPRINELLEGLDFDDRAAVIENECERLKQTIAECDYLTPEEEEDGG